jgi:hypothetical protein
MKYLYLQTTYHIAAITAVFLFTAHNAQAQATGQSVSITNPLAVNSIQELLVAILNILVVIAIPIIVFFIIYAGFLYVTARGNAAQVEQATRALTYAIIGGVLILGGVAIAEIVRNLVSSFQATP